MTNRFTLPLAAAFAFSSGPALAQPPQPGEIMLQVAGTGVVRSKPDYATLRFMVAGKGASTEAARAAAQKRLDELAASLVASGVSPGDIKAQSASFAAIGFIGNEAYGEGGPPAMLAAAAPQAKTSTISAQVTVNDMSKLTRVRELVESRMDGPIIQQSLCLRDDTAQRRSAIASAVAKARSDADSYATALGLRVARTVRVADRRAGQDQSEAMNQVFRNMAGQTDGDMVTTTVTVVEDVVLAPK